MYWKPKKRCNELEAQNERLSNVKNRRFIAYVRVIECVGVLQKCFRNPIL